MTDMDMAIGLTLGVEGGWSDHPQDPGGATRFGITHGTLKEAIRRGVVSPYTEIRTLTVSDARKIYEVMYWCAVAGDKLPRGLNALVFDVQVNSGRGGVTLQKALNSINAARITVDGQVGPMTVAAAKAVCGDPGGIYRLMDEVSARRDWFWDGLAINKTFGFGWNRRGFRVHTHAVRMACGDV